MLKRRDLLAAAAAILLPTASLGQPFNTFRLRIARNRRFADLVDLDDCLTGKMYLLGDSPSDPGVHLCDTLELPYRDDQNDISAIRAGAYSGNVRIDGSLGWRVELDYSSRRLYIQIHTGNVPWQVRGCILVGSAGDSCQIRGGTSRAARDKIQRLYGSSTARPIEISVVEDVPS
jgi:hypothetical protein